RWRARSMRTRRARNSWCCPRRRTWRISNSPRASRAPSPTSSNRSGRPDLAHTAVEELARLREHALAPLRIGRVERRLVLAPHLGGERRVAHALKAHPALCEARALHVAPRQRAELDGDRGYLDVGQHLGGHVEGRAGVGGELFMGHTLEVDGALAPPRTGA